MQSVDNFHSFELGERASTGLENKRRDAALVFKESTTYLADDSTRGSMPDMSVPLFVGE